MSTDAVLSSSFGASPLMNPQGSIIMYVFQKETYAEKSLPVWRSLLANSSFRTVVLSFAKPYVVMKNEMIRANASSQVTFIDVLTSQAGAPPAVSDCVFLPSPNALTDISINISDFLSNETVTTIVVDSASSLELHEDSVQVMKFIQMIITKIRVASKRGVFIVTDSMSPCTADMMMFVDSVIKL